MNGVKNLIQRDPNWASENEFINRFDSFKKFNRTFYFDKEWKMKILNG